MNIVIPLFTFGIIYLFKGYNNTEDKNKINKALLQEILNIKDYKFKNHVDPPKTPPIVLTDFEKVLINLSNITVPLKSSLDRNCNYNLPQDKDIELKKILKIRREKLKEEI